LLEHLQKMRFMLRVEIADLTDSWAVLGLVPGGPAEAALGRVVAEPGRVWTDPWPATAPGGVCYTRVPDDEHPGWQRPWAEIRVPRGDLARSVGETPLAGTWAAQALRVAAWRPRFGFDTDHRTIPHELDWLRTAVHLHKGCYRGQETVARVHNLGRPPRRLVLLHLDGSTHRLPERGEEVHVDGGGRPIGRVTSPARHHELGPIALAVVKRSVPTDRPLLVGASPQTAISASQQPVVER
jgi:folate-binding protein YgfZ